MESEGITEGYIYIMFNEMFNYYGPDTVKIGKSIDVAKRMNAYTTSYVKPTELKYVSQLCKNYTLAESAVLKNSTPSGWLRTGSFSEATLRCS